VSKRQAAFLLAKVAFAAGALWLLFHKIDPLRVWNSIRYANPACVGGGVVLCWLGVAIAGWRWHRLLRIFDIEIPLRSLVCIAQVGQFFMMFLPGPTGDDLTRMLYISRLAKGRVAEACTTVVIDRVIGLISILVLAVLCIPWQWHLLTMSRQTYWMALAILGAGGLVSILCTIFFLIGHPTHLWFERRLRSLPAINFRDELARIWGLLCANKGSIAQVIGAALTTQVLICLLFYLAGTAVGIHAPILAWLSFVPIVLAANAAPITVAGIGVREYLLVLFLGVLAHVDGERALAASFVAFSMILTVCLLGGLLYIFYRPKGKSNNSSDIDEAAV
jgi:uncharacterized protein (TIRG00374 family)